MKYKVFAPPQPTKCYFHINVAVIIVVLYPTVTEDI